LERHSKRVPVVNLLHSAVNRSKHITATVGGAVDCHPRNVDIEWRLNI
jgi:hypothetical protein